MKLQEKLIFGGNAPKMSTGIKLSYQKREQEQLFYYIQKRRPRTRKKCTHLEYLHAIHHINNAAFAAGLFYQQMIRSIRREIAAPMASHSQLIEKHTPPALRTNEEEFEAEQRVKALIKIWRSVSILIGRMSVPEKHLFKKVLENTQQKDTWPPLSPQETALLKRTLKSLILTLQKHSIDIAFYLHRDAYKK